VFFTIQCGQAEAPVLMDVLVFVVLAETKTEAVV
jgi:hypothetical protein